MIFFLLFVIILHILNKFIKVKAQCKTLNLKVKNQGAKIFLDNLILNENFINSIH